MTSEISGFVMTNEHAIIAFHNVALVARDITETCAEIPVLPSIGKGIVDEKAITECDIFKCKKMFENWVSGGFT